MTVQVLDIKKQNTPPTSCVITVGYETYLCRTPNPPPPKGGMGNHLPPSRGGCVGVIEKEEDRGWSE
jgi:hypothetical protein